MNAKHKILIVEDKQNERQAIARLLTQEDYEVVLSENPQQAIGFLGDSVDLVAEDKREQGIVFPAHVVRRPDESPGDILLAVLVIRKENKADSERESSLDHGHEPVEERVHVRLEGADEVDDGVEIPADEAELAGKARPG